MQHGTPRCNKYFNTCVDMGAKIPSFNNRTRTEMNHCKKKTSIRNKERSVSMGKAVAQMAEFKRSVGLI